MRSSHRPISARSVPGCFSRTAGSGGRQHRLVRRHLPRLCARRVRPKPITGHVPPRCRLLFRRLPLDLADLWERLGGLDEDFAPAYYEETDFACGCMPRAIGSSMIRKSSSTISNSAAKRKSGDSVEAMKRNQALIQIPRHAAVLRQQHLPPRRGQYPGGTLGRRPHPRPRLLVLDNDVPLGAGGAGYPRARELLSAAATSRLVRHPLPAPCAGDRLGGGTGGIRRRDRDPHAYTASRLADFMREAARPLRYRPHQPAGEHDAAPRHAGATPRPV